MLRDVQGRPGKTSKNIDYATMRNIVDRAPLIGAIINTRIDQIKKLSVHICQWQK